MEESAKMTPVVTPSEKLQTSEVRQKPPVEGDFEDDDIEDEVADSPGEDGIEDFYGDDTLKNANSKVKKALATGAEVGEEEANDLEEEDLDLDYSQTHLDDFLKSHNSSTMMKGSNI